MIKAFKELRHWAGEHPVLACVYSALTVGLAVWHGTRPWLDVFDLVPWILLISVVGFTLWIDSLKLLTATLIASMLLVPQEQKAAEKPQSGLAVAGVVVVVVGGVVTFCLVRFCQNHFPRVDPPQTNAPPSFDATDIYAAATSYSASGQCYTPTPTDLMASGGSGTVFELEGGFDTEFNYRMTGCRKVVEPESAVDFNELENELVPWGIRLGGGGESYFGLNGKPTDASMVPITFGMDGQNPTVDVARGDWVQTVVWERSSDLVNWTPMLTMTISAEQRVRFSDCRQEGQSFYRCRPMP